MQRLHGCSEGDCSYRRAGNLVLKCCAEKWLTSVLRLTTVQLTIDKVSDKHGPGFVTVSVSLKYV